MAKKQAAPLGALKIKHLLVALEGMERDCATIREALASFDPEHALPEPASSTGPGKPLRGCPAPRGECPEPEPEPEPKKAKKKNG
jgi:hypothetical protein